MSLPCKISGIKALKSYLMVRILRQIIIKNIINAVIHESSGLQKISTCAKFFTHKSIPFNEFNS